MAKQILIALFALAMITFIAWCNFKSDRQTNDVIARNDFFKLTLKNSKDKVAAVEKLDSILSKNPEYVKLKKQQYNLFVSQRNFALPPPDSIRERVISESGIDRKYAGINEGRTQEAYILEHDADMAVWLFRLAVMYSIIEDFPHPNNPSKEKITKDIFDKYAISEY